MILRSLGPENYYMKYRILTLALLGGLFAFSPAAKKIEFKFKLAPNKTYKQETKLISNTTQTVQGSEMNSKNGVSSVTYMEVKEEGDTASVYSVWYDELSMDIEGMGMNQSFSSDTSSLAMVDPMSSILAGLVEKKFDATINTKGKVTYVENLEEIIESAVGTAGGAQADMIKEQISSSFGDGGFAKNIEMSTRVVPEDPIKVGDSWEVQQYTSTGLPLILTNNFTLKEVNNGVATIGVKGSLKVDPANAKTTIQGMNATYFMDGTRKGEIMVEVETGWMQSGTLTDNIVGSISLEANPQMPNGMTIPMEMNNETTITSAE
jgi:hypothetical protein